MFSLSRRTWSKHVMFASVTIMLVYLLLYRSQGRQVSEVSLCILNAARGRSRILFRGAQWSFDPKGGPEPKICSKLPENCMILKTILGAGSHWIR